MIATHDQPTRWSRLGKRVVESIANKTDRSLKAEALYYVLCCGLAKPSDPSCTSSCPSSYNLYAWACCHNGNMVICYECTQGSNCYQGPFYCSRAALGGSSC